MKSLSQAVDLRLPLRLAFGVVLARDVECDLAEQGQVPGRGALAQAAERRLA